MCIEPSIVIQKPYRKKKRRINRFFSLLFCFIRAMNSRSILSVGRTIDFDLVRISCAFERARTNEKWRPVWSEREGRCVEHGHTQSPLLFSDTEVRQFSYSCGVAHIELQAAQG